MPRDEGHEETEDILRKLEKRIAKEYKKAEEEVAKKLDEYLRKFEKKDEIKRKALENGLITQREYDEWRTGQIMVGKRWQEMRDSLAEDFTNANAIAKSIAYGYMPDVYALNHNYGTYQVEHGALVDTSYTLYDRHTVERLFDDNNTFYHGPGRKISDRINRGLDVAWNKKNVQSVMLQGILQGESIGKMATRLADSVGEQNRKATIRNVRTMTTGVQNAGRVDSYDRAKAMGINVQKQWMAALDGRTRHWHRELDGVSVDNDKPFVNDFGKIMYPGDPSADPANIYNCRCTLVANIKGFESDLSDLSLRNTNKLGDMTYEEWKAEKKSTSDPITKQDEIAETMRRVYGAEYNRLANGVPFNNTVDNMGKPRTEKLNINGEINKIKTYKHDAYNNIWAQTYSADSKQMCEYLNTAINKGDYGSVDRIVVMKKDALHGISAYDHVSNTLYICEEIIDPVKFVDIVDTDYFAAQSLDDIIKHELGGHKKHWDSTRRYFLDNTDRFDTIEDAKAELENNLRRYVKEQDAMHPGYIRKNISVNADENFNTGLNEIIADGILKDENTDQELMRLIKEVILYDGTTG